MLKKVIESVFLIFLFYKNSWVNMKNKCLINMIKYRRMKTNNNIWYSFDHVYVQPRVFVVCVVNIGNASKGKGIYGLGSTSKPSS